MALQDGGSLKQDVDQAPSSLQAGTAVGTGERGLCSCSRAMPERFPASTHGGSASWARERAWECLEWMALQDGGSLKQDVVQAPSSLQAGRTVGTGERGLCSWSRAMPERFPASTHGGSASWAREPAWSDLIGWRFKTAAHSSKMLTKRHRLYRLARQLAQAREGFAVAPGPCPSGSPPLLMTAARAGLVSQRGSDMI